MRARFASVLLRSSLVAVLLIASAVLLAQESGSHAALAPSVQRKAAPEFSLKDSAGKQFTLKDYRGKVLLLDFWATWCHGCKQEMPWFADLDRKYRDSGLQVVGVSMDDDGWKVVTPFLKSAAVPYQIVLGDEEISKRYHIEAMPDTFLIDRDGRIAAVYNGMVDREDIEKNIQSLLQAN